MRLAQSQANSLASATTNTGTNDSVPPPVLVPAPARGETHTSAIRKILAVVLELKQNAETDRKDLMAKVEEAKLAQEVVAREVQELHSQNQMLKDEIVELKTTLNERFLKPALNSGSSYATRALVNLRPENGQQINLKKEGTYIRSLFLYIYSISMCSLLSYDRPLSVGFIFLNPDLNHHLIT